jgi:hypothetical protein
MENLTNKMFECLNSTESSVTTQHTHFIPSGGIPALMTHVAEE